MVSQYTEVIKEKLNCLRPLFRYFAQGVPGRPGSAERRSSRLDRAAYAKTCTPTAGSFAVEPVGKDCSLVSTKIDKSAGRIGIAVEIVAAERAARADSDQR